MLFGVAVLVPLSLARAQQDVAAQPDSGWIVHASPSVDLWFHGMAMLGLYDQNAPLPLYSDTYAEEVREAKRARGIVTALDSLAPELRRDFFRGEGTELFHFVPLYFPRTAPTRMLAVLSAVAEMRHRDTLLTRPDVLQGASAVARQLVDRNTRRLLGRFATALASEWRLFYGDYWESRWREQSDRYLEVRETWTERLGPALAPFLSRARLEGGVILPSPPVGLEGRLDNGDPSDGRDNLVAVWLPAGEYGADRSTFAVLKELCFVLADRVRIPAPGARGEQQALQARAAVRCGHLLLEFYEPTLLARYRRVFLEARGRGDSEKPVETFEQLYALPPAVYDALREEVRRR